MIVERQTLIVEKDRRFQTQETGRLDIYFDGRDIDALVDPTIGHIGDRFMGCTDTGFLDGWQPEDKISVRMDTPRDEHEDARVVELQLDQGGDLYFTIWKSLALRNYRPTEFAAREPFLTADPSKKLAYVGITSFCLHQLGDISRRFNTV